MNKVFMRIGIVLGVIALILGGVALEGLLVQWLWNWIIVALLPVSPIGFSFACGVVLVLSVLGGLFRVTVNTKK